MTAAATPAASSTVANPYALLTPSGAGSDAGADAAAADRFLKLLVTQMQNQDPLNPMDNAQVTSQMAQINTVSGIEKLNGSVQSLNGRFVQMQALAGASLVGRDITVAGSRLAVEGGRGVGGFDLGATAGSVSVEILNAAGRVVDRLSLGAQGAGRHGFEWAPREPVADDAQLRFRVVATNGAAAVAATPLMRDRIDAVATGGDHLVLDTRHGGRIEYADVIAFN